jgi:ATP-dependent Lon protease
MRIFAQWISNPGSKGHCIGIQGPPGIAKTCLVKDGICKALGLPFGFIALGGASDASFLEGHSFTYEGSTYGKIAEILMKTQCMNPIMFFDELDKVSSTSRGEEIIGILTHLTDASQNERFQDRYFGALELNLSRALIIFSYNDESKINPILKDRMITIHAKGYSLKDKMIIARDYLLPEVLSQYNISTNDVKFPSSIIETIIGRVAQEEGVRNLKRGLESIVSWINMNRYLPPEDDIPNEFPLTVTEDHIHKYLHVSESPNDMSPEVARMMYL